MRWAGHVARMGEERKMCKVLVGNPEGKRPLGRPSHGWEDGIRMDMREIGLIYQGSTSCVSRQYSAKSFLVVWFIHGLLITQTMKAVSTSETLVSICLITQHNILEEIFVIVSVRT
jgi:hypothetical protein